MKIRKLSALIIIPVLAFGLTACDDNRAATNGGGDIQLSGFYEKDVTLKDGRTVHCVYLKEGGQQLATGGPSCDWANAK